MSSVIKNFFAFDAKRQIAVVTVEFDRIELQIRRIERKRFEIIVQRFQRNDRFAENRMFLAVKNSSESNNAAHRKSAPDYNFDSLFGQKRIENKASGK